MGACTIMVTLLLFDLATVVKTIGECQATFRMVPCQNQEFQRTTLSFFDYHEWTADTNNTHKLVCDCNEDATTKNVTYEYFSLTRSGTCNGLNKINGQTYDVECQAKECDEKCSSDAKHCNLDSKKTNCGRCKECADETVYRTGDPMFESQGQNLNVDPEAKECEDTYTMLKCQNQGFSETLLFYYTINDWKSDRHHLHKLICLCRNEAKLKGFDYCSLSSGGICNGMKKLNVNQNDNVGCAYQDPQHDNHCELDAVGANGTCAGTAFAETVYSTKSWYDEEVKTCQRTFQILACQSREFTENHVLFFYKFEEWRKNHDVLHRLACLCNNEAHQKNFEYFSLSPDGMCSGLHKEGDPYQVDEHCENDTKHCNIDVDIDCTDAFFEPIIFKTGNPQFLE